MANPNPNLTTRFQPGNQMAKLSIGKKRRQLTSAFLDVLDPDKLRALCLQLYDKALNPNDPDQHRAKELLMKYTIVPTTATVEVKQKQVDPQILTADDLDCDAVDNIVIENTDPC